MIKVKSKQPRKDSMKLSSPLALLLVPFSSSFPAASSDRDVEVFDPKDATDNGHRRLQEEEAVDEEDPVTFQLKMVSACS